MWTLPTTLFGHVMGLAVCRQRPRWVESAAAYGWLYRIPPGLGVLDRIGAVTLGHVVLHGATTLDGERGRAVLAHELAHTRQHDVLGPFYLPLHATAQLASAIIGVFTGPATFSPVHDHNPLEQTFIAISANAIDRWPLDAAREAVLAAFGA
jgi:hypothetical protein